MPKLKPGVEMGDIQREILAYLDTIPADQAVDSDTVHAHVSLSGTPDGTKATLKRLATKGRIGRCIVGSGRYRTALHWGLGHPERTLTPTPRAQAIPMPSPDTAIEDTPLHGLQWEDSDPAQPADDVQYRARYGLFDDGSLEIWRGMEFRLRLDAEETARLIEMLTVKA